jgi:hypothetical protein
VIAVATDAAIAAFVDDVRARRIEAGRPDHIEADAVYRLLDGLLARGGGPDAGAA